MPFAPLEYRQGEEGINMANPWFRLYSELQDDPEIQMLPEHMQRRFVMLLCSRCKTENLSDTVIAFQWRMPMEDVLETKQVFIGAGFIDENWKIAAWDKRQFVSDNVTERVRKFRKNDTRNGKETLHETHQNRTEQREARTLTKKDYGFGE
jgi:hypothetical protein